MWICENCETENSEANIQCEVCNNNRIVSVYKSATDKTEDELVPNTPIKPPIIIGCIIAIIVIACLFIFTILGASNLNSITHRSNNNSTTVQTDDSSSEQIYITKTPYIHISQKTSTPSIYEKSSNTSSTTIKPIPSNYVCPDIDQIELQIGSTGMIKDYDVNLRNEPVVPEQWNKNIIVALHKGDQLQVIDGPKCSHDGTWWKVITEFGDTGWMREIQPSIGRLIVRIDG